MDDMLSYELPDEPSVAHLVRKLITDFTVFETGMKTTAGTSTQFAARLFESQMASPEAHKNQSLISYAAGRMDAKSAADALRESYRQEAEKLERDIGAGRALGYERKLLS